MPDRVHTLDLHFQDRPCTIAAYLLPHADGATLVETGPGSTAATLQAQLAEHGLTPNDISEVLLTHIHLDHAGAVGWLAEEHGATVYVHPAGAPHLADPTRLLKSAERVFGEEMDRLWGEMRAVPADQIVELSDGDTADLGDRSATAFHTPGHASHHLSYVVDTTLFTGDVGGVRLPGETYVEVPLVPPELRLDHWRNSLDTLREVVDEYNVPHLAPTHFGLYEDVEAHLDWLDESLTAAEDWVEESVPNLVGDEDALREATTEWIREQAMAQGVDEATWALYELADPSWMAAMGVRRYWQNHVASS